METTNRLNLLTKNTNLLAVVILALVLVAFYRDVVFDGRTFLMQTTAPGTMPGAGPYKYKGARPAFVVNDAGAIAWYREPLNRFVSRSLQESDLPLWNPYSGLAGSPLLADGQTAPLEPLQFLFYFVPDQFWPLATDLQLLARFFLAGFTCFLFARRQGIDFFGSISAGILFMLSSYFVTYGNHPQIKTEALLPLVLYGYDRLVDHKDKQGFWLCALFIGWAIVAAMPESSFFALFLGTLWYFYKSINHWIKTGRSFSEARNTVLRYAGSTILGFLISAAYLLPFIEYVLLAKSVHSPGPGSPPYVWRLLPGLIFQVRSRFFLHLGFFALFGLVFSLLSFKHWSRYRQHIFFFGLYAATFILTIFDFPLTNWIRGLPILNQIVFQKYSIPSIVLCLAILVGILIDRARNEPLSYKNLTLSLLILSIVFVAIPGIKKFEWFSDYSSELKFISAAAELIIYISVLLYISAFYRRSRLYSPYLLQITFLIIVCLEPFLWATRTSRPTRIDPFQVPPFVSFLHRDEDFRIFGFDGTLYPNISTAYQLADIRWLTALVPERVYDFSARFIESKEVNTLRLTGTVLPISDHMFDLLNVKYVLRQNSYIEIPDSCSGSFDNQPYFGENTLNTLIFEKNRGKKNFFPELPLNINGITRMSIFAQPPQRFEVDLVLPEEPSKLDFSLGLNPDVFLPEYGDGVIFRIILLEHDNQVEIFSKYIDPKNNPCDRKWFDESVNLDKWAGKVVTLRFITAGGPSKNTAYDLAYWGDIRLAANSSDQVNADIPDSSYKQVYQDQHVWIYRNEDVYPRAFVVHNIINAPSFGEALELLGNPDIDLRHTAIVEDFPTDLRAILEKNKQELPGSAEVKRITPDSMAIEVELNSPGLLVISEQYYPGWQAYIDGKETPIYAVDGILRGIFLEAGKHRVTFDYRPLSFSIGLIASIVSLILTVTGLAYVYRQSHHIGPQAS